MAIARKYFADDKTFEYLNSYPAFDTDDSCKVDRRFYNWWFDSYGRQVAEYYDPISFEGDDDLFDYQSARDMVKDYINTVPGLTVEIYEKYIRPGILRIYGEPSKADSVKNGITRIVAEYIIKYIEPKWCRYKRIESTGFVNRTELEKAAELLADDEFEEI